MSTATRTQDVSVVEGDRRVGDYDWPLIAQHLDAHGWALLPKLLTASECATIAGLYTDDRLFRSHIVMARHGFGRGEYKYFTYPLPEKVTALRRRSTRTWLRSPTGGAFRWDSMNATPTRTQTSSPGATTLGRRGRHRFCCSMARATSTRCIRTFTASMCFRCRWRFFSLNQTQTSPAVSLC